MAHEITQHADGRSEVFTAGQPAWHGLGVNVQNTVTWKEAIKLAHLDWKVDKRQLLAPDGKPVQAWGNFRSDTNAFLGAVGEKYTPIQIPEQFDFVDSILEAKEGSHYESAGSVFGGKKVWCLARVPEDIRIKGTDDVSKTYLMFLNPNDGSGSGLCKFVTTRVVCWNTLSMALRETGKAIKIRHTPSAPAKLAAAKAFLQGVGGQIKDLNTLYNALALFPLDIKTIRELIIKKVFPEVEENAVQQNKASLILELFEDNDGNAFKSQRGTAFAMVNAFTRYTDHYASARLQEGEGDDKARARNAMFGIGDVFKLKILQAITHACFLKDAGAIPETLLFDRTKEVTFT